MSLSPTWESMRTRLSCTWRCCPAFVKVRRKPESPRFARRRLLRARSPAAVKPLRGPSVPLRPLRVTAAIDRGGKLLRTSRKAGPRSTAGGGFRQPSNRGRWPHVVEILTRCGSKQAPSRSIARATLSRRSATDRRARAGPWPRARSA